MRGVREAGKERAGSRRNKGKLSNIARYFAIEKGQKGGSQDKRGGSRDCKLREAGGLDPAVPSP